MNKIKKRYNWKARQIVGTDVDNSAAGKVCIDSSSFKSERYDDCNTLVLPSEKRKTKKRKESLPVPTKILSKKQRKRLEKIVDKKKKKENRAALLVALSQVQVAPELSSQLTSIATVQTRGLKRQRSHAQIEELIESTTVVQELNNEKRQKISSIAGSKKLKKKLLPPPEVNDDNGSHLIDLEKSAESSELSDSGDEVEVLEKVCPNEMPSEKAHTDEIQEVKPAFHHIQETTVPKSVVVTASSPDVTMTKESCAAAVFVPVARPPALQAARLKLPVLAEEQVIMEAVRENPVVVLAGETGSGKTTQVPQFLYEAGYARDGKIIGVTEPRRVAAISMSQRVAQEMGLSEQEVSYLIRFEGNASPNTRILFMTDGVLLREARHDLLLSRYSAIIVDEAHERSTFTDILVGLLSRVVKIRAQKGDPLKLIIMSATLRLADFTENPRLFKTPPPVINVESRQYPVTVHFARRTVDDYLSEAFRKACKVHTELPEGGILVFLTGQQEVKSLVRRLRRAFPFTEQNALASPENQHTRPTRWSKRRQPPKLPVIDLDSFPLRALDDDDAGPLDSEMSSDDEGEVNVVGSCAPLWVLPLYSLLPSYEQARVFAPPPVGTRLCVVATNVAETSLTIPGVKYVIDSGRAKTRNYDKLTGVSAFKVDWTSKASADQRAGRAGRVGPGHCYRLYSSAVFSDQLPEFAEPDIQRRPADDLVLQMKAMGIHKVVNFPFPSAPDLLQLRAAERRLTLLGALETPKDQGSEEFTGRLTELGRAISAFPVAPRYGKMLALSAQHPGLLPHAVNLVAALSVPELLLDPAGTSKACGLAGQSKLLGDPSVLLRVMCAVERAAQDSEDALSKLCEQRHLRYKGVLEVRKLRAQLTSEINLSHPELDLYQNPKLPPPSETQARLLRQVVLSGMVDQVAVRVSLEEIKIPQERVKWKHSYRCGELEEPVFMQASSVLRKSRPQWVVYQEIYETSKMYMRGVTAIEPEWLPVYALLLCNLSSPLPDPPPRLDPASCKLLCSVTGTFGKGGWELPRMELEFPKGLNRYKFFAQLLLEGSLFPKLQKFKSCLLSTPATVSKIWTNLVPRATMILQALSAEEVDNQQRIIQVWKSNPQFLLNVYQQWLPESAHNEVALIWPPL